MKKDIGSRSEPSLLDKNQKVIILDSTKKVPPINDILNSRKCHLKLEGEINYVPEYRSKFIEFPIEKSQSIPQLSNIKFYGRFDGIPEYRDNFKFYDCYSKSAPIKKSDNINFTCDKIVTVPEYKEKFKEPDKTAISKTISLKSEDNFQKTIKGEFTKILPEYNESFKDPQIKEKPERGKCREPYLRLKGRIEFNPEYSSSYLNYPRSRPITKKTTSSIQFSSNTRKKSSLSPSKVITPRRKFSTSITNKITDSNQEVPFTCQPEYRKAKREYLIKERPITRKITEIHGTIKTITKNSNESIPNETSKSMNIQKQQYKGKNLVSSSSVKRNNKNIASVSPQLRLNVENIEDFEKKFHKSSPKYGRRSTLRSTNHNNAREKTKIIECNPKYLSTTMTSSNRRNSNVNYNSNNNHQSSLSLSQRKYKNNNNDSSFIILDEPCKKNTWMKRPWYDP